jgi:uncharacterized Tic20 family protein
VRRLHLSILVPVLGLVVPLSHRRDADPEVRRSAGEALSWQLAAALVTVVHGGMQGAIELIAWIQALAAGARGNVHEINNLIVVLLRVLNLGAWGVEWLGLVACAAVAARTGRYPVPLPRAFGGSS